MDRYQKLKSEAPFAVATADTQPVEQKIDWAEPLYLSGASKFTENGVEKPWVYIGHKSDPSAAFQLYGTEPNALGIQIVKLDWHEENPLKTEVTLKKGNEFATLKRDQAAFSAPSMPQPQQGVRPGQPNPVVIPNANGVIRPPATVQPPRTPQIPRPGSVIPPPQQKQTYPQPAPGAQQNQGTDRRRVRVINR
jgi:hypothetical protein